MYIYIDKELYILDMYIYMYIGIYRHIITLKQECGQKYLVQSQTQTCKNMYKSHRTSQTLKQLYIAAIINQ